MTRPSRSIEALPSRAVWRAALPVLRTRTAILREVTSRDTGPLTIAMSQPEVRKYLPLGPTTQEQFSRFIRWVRRERRAGRYVCFAVVPHGRSTAAGLFQLWPVEPGFGTAEMGFALDRALWGTDTFIDCATAIVDFAVDVLNVQRLECRSAITNTRGTAALMKLGAVQEGTLRRCFRCPAGVLDHTIWSVLVDEWRQRRAGGWRCA